MKDNRFKRAIIYTRVSSREQVDEGNSLVTQERLCREYALKHNYEIVEVFVEQGESAKTTLRTELQRMLTYCTNRKNKIEAVLTYKLDRIARQSDDYSYIRILLKRYDVEIKSITEYFENTPAGRFMENVIVSVSQFDNDMRAERTKGGMEEAVKEGRFVFLAPYGYDNVRVAGKSNIAPNHFAPIIRKTFEEVAQYTGTLEDIRAKMTREGLLTKSGKPIAKSLFYRMLRSEIYAGWIVKYGTRYRGIFDPIVSQETFDQVQRVLAGKTRRAFVYQKENPDFPLRRFIISEYGRKITGCWSRGRNKRYAYYRFKSESGMHKKEYMESLFKIELDKLRYSKEDQQKLHAFVQEVFIEKTEREQRETELLKKQVQELQRRQRTLIEKNYTGVIPDAILKQELDVIEHEIGKLHLALSRIDKRDKQDWDNVVDTTLQFLKSPAKTWEIAPFEQKLALQWFAFPCGMTLLKEKSRTAQRAFNFKANELFSVPLSQNGFFSKRSSKKSSKDDDTIVLQAAQIKSNLIHLYDILTRNVSAS
ncbi:MAG: recombinase family protein [Bacteroidia bacterium]|nr:recombinase family protein [Bacteroidia bacterium]